MPDGESVEDVRVPALAAAPPSVWSYVPVAERRRERMRKGARGFAYSVTGIMAIMLLLNQWPSPWAMAAWLTFAYLINDPLLLFSGRVARGRAGEAYLPVPPQAGDQEQLVVKVERATGRAGLAPRNRFVRRPKRGSVAFRQRWFIQGGLEVLVQVPRTGNSTLIAATCRREASAGAYRRLKGWIRHEVVTKAEPPAPIDEFVEAVR